MGEEEYIFDVAVTRCLGAKFQRDGGREVMHEEKKRKIGGMVKKLSETRRVLGEKAAVEAWRVFSKTVMLNGVEVFGWGRAWMRKEMEMLQREAWRWALGLDKGVNSAVLQGETGEWRVAADGVYRMLRYGVKMQKCEKGTLRRLAWEVRQARELEGKSGKWAKDVKEARRGIGLWGRTLEVLKEDEEGLKRRIEEKEVREWEEQVRRSERSLEVYKEVVRKPGEMKKTQKMAGVERWGTWWRRFRTGGIMGRCRGSAWKGEKCWACGDENGGVLHFATRCEDTEVVEMRRRVLRRVEDELVEDERDRWNRLEEGERVWVTLGKRVNGEVWEKAEALGPGSWWKEWQDGGWEGWLRRMRGGGVGVDIESSGEEEELRVRARGLLDSSEEEEGEEE